ncbi:unnamed protein product [Protopolystoma xenopodis]|uniref:Uncharacterized protein n=1 Tax=Protopolystoma xenopodis TaxID=117903 RepID=A0A3S5A3L0_9PLAT|nr:unnamed protein product [Protopolystoma xenopodis]
MKHFYHRAKKVNFDVNRYNELCDQLGELKSDLRRLRDPLLCQLPLQQTSLLVPEHVHDSLARGLPRYAQDDHLGQPSTRCFSTRAPPIPLPPDSPASLSTPHITVPQSL